MKTFFALLMMVSTVASAKTIKVMVIDTGIDEHDALKPYVQYRKNADYKPTEMEIIRMPEHGTHVAGIIVYGNQKSAKDIPFKKSPLCDQVKIYSCNYLNRDNFLKNEISCFRRAIKAKMDYVNYSGGGTDFSKEENAVIKKYIDQGGILITVAGNEKSDLNKESFFPASLSEMVTDDPESQAAKNKVTKLPGIIAVTAGSRDPEREYASFSNRYPTLPKELGESIYSTLPGNTYGTMSGTSQAAPAYLHKLLIERCKTLKGEK